MPDFKEIDVPPSELDIDIDVSISTRTYMSKYHLKSASKFAEKAEELENQEDGGVRRQWGHVNASIMASMAFLEGEVNGFLADLAEDHTNYEDFDSQAKQKVSNWMQNPSKRDKLRIMNPLETMNKALELCDLSKFEKGQNPYQDADTVRRVRNYIVHHTPEFVPGNNEELFNEHDLAAELKTKDFELNPLAGSGNAFFPYHVLGSGFAYWCLESCIELVDQFWDRIGKEPRYDNFRDELVV